MPKGIPRSCLKSGVPAESAVSVFPSVLRPGAKLSSAAFSWRPLLRQPQEMLSARKYSGFSGEMRSCLHPSPANQGLNGGRWRQGSRVQQVG